MFKIKVQTLVIFSQLCVAAFLGAINPPKLTIVMVVDQGAYHYFPRLQKNFAYGLKELLEKGIVYTRAYHAHGVPETTPGHHAISTGTLPWYHGAAFNDWIQQTDYKMVFFDEDSSDKAKILNGHSGGKSYKKTMVDGFSDQAMLDQKKEDNYTVMALSLKSYPAIAMANHTGKALWFNDKNGGFTSSKTYFEQLPKWVGKVNTKLNLGSKKFFEWKSAYPINSAKYNYQDIDDYSASALPFSIVKKGGIDMNKASSCPYDFFIKTPNGGAALITLAKACIKEHFVTKGSKSNLLLWVSLSNLDLITHLYGPYSYEAIDTFYHVDKQIQKLMVFARKIVGAKKCLFALTADHGIVPIPEILQKHGFTQAKRVMCKPLIDGMNKLIAQKYAIKEIVKSYEPTYFVLNREALASLEPGTRHAVITELKNFLKTQPGIRKAWHIDELKHTTFPEGALENLYKTQIYDNRIGDLIVMPQPYCLITNYSTGTSHLSPYEYDTHVPLFIYHKDLKHQIIDEKVYVPQLPATLAKLLNITKPAASPYGPLPGI